MTAQCGSTTPLDGQQHFDVLPTNPGAVSFDEGSSCGPDEIGRLIYFSCGDWPSSDKESNGLEAACR